MAPGGLAVPNNAWQSPQECKDDSDGSPRKAYRRVRSNTMLTSAKQKTNGRPKGVKPMRVIVRFNGNFGGKWDSFQETGNGETRVYVKVASTGLEYPVDSIIDPARAERSATRLVVEPVVDDMEESRDYGVFAYGPPETGKSNALFSGDDDELGVAYGFLQKLVAKQRNLAARSDARAELTLSFFELHDGDVVRDLLNPDNTEAKIAAQQPAKAREVAFEGLTAEVVTDEEHGTNLIFDALARRSAPECATDPHTVLKFTVSFDTDHKKETNSIYAVEINANKNSSFKTMLQKMADGDLTNQVFTTTLTRLIMPKLLDYGYPRQCYVIACMGAKMADRSDTLATLKTMRNAHELRVEAAIPQLGRASSPGGTSPMLIRIGDGSASDMTIGLPGSSPQIMSELGCTMGDVGNYSHAHEVRFRQTEGKLEAQRQQVRRLEEEIVEKKREVDAEAQRRLLAEQRYQDEQNARNLLEQRNNTLIKINKESEEKYFKAEGKIRELRNENVTLSQFLVQERRQLKQALSTKKVIEEEMGEMKTKLGALLAEAADGRKLNDVCDGIRKLIDLPHPEEAVAEGGDRGNLNNAPVRQRSPVRPKKRSGSYDTPTSPALSNAEPMRSSRAGTTSPVSRAMTSSYASVRSRSSSQQYVTPKYRTSVSSTYSVTRTATRTKSPRRAQPPRSAVTAEHRSPLTNSSPGATRVRTKSRERKSGEPPVL